MGITFGGAGTALGGLTGGLIGNMVARESLAAIEEGYIEETKLIIAASIGGAMVGAAAGASAIDGTVVYVYEETADE